MTVPSATGSDGQWRVGIDTGGTFADLVVQPPGEQLVRLAKLSRDCAPEQLAEALVSLGVRGKALVVHGTTHVTNAILEANFARTGLVTTRGFRDVLRIGRQSRDHLYELQRPARLAAIVPPELTYELDERCTADGTVIEELDDDQLLELVRWAREGGLEAVAVCLLHAYANPAHERRVGEALIDVVAVSLSHEISGEAREYERASAAVLNAAVQGGTRAYLTGLGDAITRAVPEASLFVLQSAGGMVPTEAACARPIATVMSGPAAGAAAVSLLARRARVARAVTCDIGGTSTDVSLIIDGTPAVARDRQVGGRVVRVPTIAVESIAMGGGSIIAFDDVGALTVGPRSAGASPGPACYGRGGTKPTITDAALECGLIGAGGEVPGLELHRDLARSALQQVARPMGLSVGELAWRAVDVAQGTIAAALTTVVSRQGYDLRDCVLVAYGGGGPIHAGQLAERIGITRVLIPAMAPVLSAVGCCLAEVGVEAVRTHRCPLSDDSLPLLEKTAVELADIETQRLGEPPGQIAVARWLELRYVGQNSELAIPWTTGATARELSEEFARAHEREYGFTAGDLIEATAVRCRLEVGHGRAWPAMDVDYQPRTTSAALTLGRGTRVEVPVIGIAALGGVVSVEGPALIAARFGSITVCPGQRAQLDADANVVLDAL